MARGRHFSEAAYLKQCVKAAEAAIRTIEAEIARTPCDDTERLAALRDARQEKREDIVQWQKQMLSMVL